MLDYNTLNNLVEAFNKNGVSNVKLEDGSTLEIKEGQLLINGEPLSIDIGVINTDNITGLSTETIEELKAGDLVLKYTGNQIHAYKVTYKEEHQGICISYYAAGYSETVSYDYVDGAWVYNSTDVSEVINYTAGNGISIEDGVITNTKPDGDLYEHNIELTSSGTYISKASLTIINNSSTPFDFNGLINWLTTNNFVDSSHHKTATGIMGVSSSSFKIICGISTRNNQKIYYTGYEIQQNTSTNVISISTSAGDYDIPQPTITDVVVKLN